MSIHNLNILNLLVRNMQAKYSVGSLPSNEYAFTNNVYLSKKSFSNILSSGGGKEPLFVDIKGYILRSDSLDSLTDSVVGMS